MPAEAAPLPRLLLGNSRLRAGGEAFLDRWYASGGRGLDTARVYGQGESERTIGRWLRASGARDVRILTKACHPDSQGSRLNPEALRSDLAESLERLGCERVAVLLLHRDDPRQPAAEILDWLGRIVDDGLAEAVGVSNWHHERIAAANAWARSAGRPTISWNSPQLSAVAPTAPLWEGCLSIADDADALAWHARPEAPRLLAWQPLARGYLTDAALHGAISPPPGFDSAANRRRREALAARAAANGRRLEQEALAELLGHPRCHIALGTATLAHWQAAQAVIEPAELHPPDPRA